MTEEAASKIDAENTEWECDGRNKPSARAQRDGRSGACPVLGVGAVVTPVILSGTCIQKLLACARGRPGGNTGVRALLHARMLWT